MKCTKKAAGISALVIASLLAVTGTAIALCPLVFDDDDYVMDEATIAEVEGFQQQFDEQVESQEKFIVILSGAIDESTGESWCPHSNYARQYIDQLVEAIDGRRTILREYVERSEWKGNSDHPYRQDPFNVQSVPAILLFEGETELHRAEELSDFIDNDVMNGFLVDLN